MKHIERLVVDPILSSFISQVHPQLHGLGVAHLTK